MKQQDKLRKTLREYYDNQEAPFNEHDWERASAYLDAARRRRRIIQAVIIASALLLSVLFTAIISIPTTNKQQASSPSPKILKTEPPIHPEVSHVPTTVPAPKARKIINSNPVTTVVSLSPDLISKPQSQKNTPELKAASSQPEASQLPSSKPDAMPAESVAQTNTQKKENAPDHQPEAARAVAAGAVAAARDKEEAVQLATAGVTEEKAPLIPTKMENQTPGEDHLSPKEITQVPAVAFSETAKPLSLNENKKEITVTDTENLLIPAGPVSSAVLDTLHHSPITNAILIAEPAREDTLSMASSHHNLAGEGIFYEAGAAWLNGWKSPVGHDARGFSPVVAINYMNRLGKHYAVSFGIGYQQVNNLSGSSKTSRISTFLYGEQSKVTVITPATIHYLVAPLRFHYYLNSKNIFGAGINLAYLLNVDAKVMSYDEKPGLSENYETVKLGGYTEGFNWFDSQLAFFYRRRIVGPLCLQAEIFLGLTDVKQDGFFGFVNKEKNSGAKLSLIYYAFKKNGRR